MQLGSALVFQEEVARARRELEELRARREAEAAADAAAAADASAAEAAEAAKAAAAGSGGEAATEGEVGGGGWGVGLGGWGWEDGLGGPWGAVRTLGEEVCVVRFASGVCLQGFGVAGGVGVSEIPRRASNRTWPQWIRDGWRHHVTWLTMARLES